MKDMLKNMFYIGAGAAFLTKEKLEELRTELIEKGKMTQDEGKQFIDDIVKKSEEAKTQLDEQIHGAITAQLKNMDIATGDDIGYGAQHWHESGHEQIIDIFHGQVCEFPQRSHANPGANTQHQSNQKNGHTVGFVGFFRQARRFD